MNVRKLRERLSLSQTSLAALVGAVAIVIQGRDERAKPGVGTGEERNHG